METFLTPGLCSWPNQNDMLSDTQSDMLLSEVGEETGERKEGMGKWRKRGKKEEKLVVFV